MTIDYLIVGQGLAGSLAAWECTRRGRSFQVVDPGTGQSASHTAAGLYNPISGKRLVHDPAEEHMLVAAHETYANLASQWNAPAWVERNILRFFTSGQQQAQYEKRLKDAAYTPYLGPLLDSEILPKGLRAPWGGFMVRQGGQVHLPGIIQAVREWLKANDRLIEESFRHDELTLGKQGVEYAGYHAGTVLFCEGYRVSLNPYFDSIPWRHAKGEVLQVSIPGLVMNEVIHHGVYLAPAGGENFILGATYEWDELDEEPTAAGQEELLAGLKTFCDLPVKVLQHRAAVRPVAYDRAAVIGRHPEYPSLALLNGLGAKGAVRGPWMAKTLMDHLEDGMEFDTRYSVDHHWRPEIAS